MGNPDEDAISNVAGALGAQYVVSVDDDEYTISFTVPEIDNGIGVRDWTLEDSGGCGPPYGNHESNSVKWTSPELYEQAKGKIDHSKPVTSWPGVKPSVEARYWPPRWSLRR